MLIKSNFEMLDAFECVHFTNGVTNKFYFNLKERMEGRGGAIPYIFHFIKIGEFADTQRFEIDGNLCRYHRVSIHFHKETNEEERYVECFITSDTYKAIKRELQIDKLLSTDEKI